MCHSDLSKSQIFIEEGKMTTISAPIPQQSPEIQDYADIDFEVEGRTVGANKALLCMVSPVFKTMLEGNFKEARLSKIPLPNKKYNAFVEFIEVTHLHKSITSGNVRMLLPLFHEYDCDRLLKKCEEVLLNEEASLRNYYLADSYGLKELYRKSLTELKKKNYFSIRDKNPREYSSLKKQAKIDYLEATLESIRPKQWDLWNTNPYL